ncbi:hypothetical protein MXB_1833 [Myxobolus squamalis]|nr:hypothetical protein MXB_1833 [Myxobolus squamalis]
MTGESNKNVPSKSVINYESEFVDSTLAYNSSLDVFAEYMAYRGTSIICTIGPACANVDTLVEMINAGMDIARFNFSHGSHEDHKRMMDLVRTASKKSCTNRPIALALDTKGPEIRTGLNKDGASITLVKDDKIFLTTDDAFKEQSTKDKLYLDYKSLTKSIKAGQIILVADGTVVLHALVIKGNEVECLIVSGATFGSRKNVCLPMVKIDLPALSEKDVSDIKFGMEQNVDMIFASFIRTADNVHEIRTLLDMTENGKHIKIVSKVENGEGVHNIRHIIDASDGVMLARGDLGMDLAMDRLPICQKNIFSLCNLAGKPVICATQMLESMISNFRPTRAEATDVENAVLDGADCVMLSGESANGKYPIEAVKNMNMFSRAAEKINRTKRVYENIKESMSMMTEFQALAMAAVSMSYKLRSDGIIALTTTGKTAYQLSMFRPRCLIFAITRSEKVARACRLFRNVYPILYTHSVAHAWADDVDARFKFGVSQACAQDLCKEGSKVILISGWKSGPGSSNCLRVVSVGPNQSIAGIN